jgi:putative FmdB family regulatory protein
MPTYEYTCKHCGEHLEVVQSFTDDPLTVCPNCGGELKKVFGNIGIVFKGSGFYKTDSRSNGSAKKTTGETPAAAEKKPEKESEPAGDAKPAASPPSAGGSSEGGGSGASTPKTAAAS